MFWTLASWSILIVGVIALLSSIRIVPTINYAAVERFGKRTGRFLKEGITLVCPFGIEQIELIPLDLVSEKIEIKATSKDGVRVGAKGSLQYRPARFEAESRFEPGKKLLMTWLEIPNATIKDGMLKTVQTELGNIAATTLTDDFIEQREAVNLFVNSILRLEKPPHLMAKTVDPTEPNDQIPPEGRLAFYKKNHAQIVAILQTEGTIGSNAPIEHLYGVDVAKVALDEIDSELEYQKAQQKKKEADRNAEALAVQTRAQVSNIEALKRAGLTAERAIVALDVLSAKGTRNVHNIEVADIKDLAGAVVALLGSKTKP